MKKRFAVIGGGVIVADNAIICTGFRCNPSMAADLYGTGIEVHEIKHANAIGNVMSAVWGAYEIARTI